MVYPLCFTIFAIFFICFLCKYSFTTTKKNSPPSLARLPIIGDLHKLGLHPHRSLQSLARRHGPLMLLHFGSVPVLVISSANGARHIMKTHDVVFANRPRSSIMEKLLYNYRDVAMAPYGEYWRQMKSICILQLLTNKRIQSFRNVREEEMVLMVNKIEESCSSCLPINLSETLVTLTNDIVCRVALGKKYSGRGGRKYFKDLLDGFVKLMGMFDIGNYIPRLAWVNHVNGFHGKIDRVAKQMNEFFELVVEEHMDVHLKSGDVHGENLKDFVDVLLWIQREHMAGFPIDRASIKALILDMFVGGTDTTFTVLEWTMTELLRHPKIMKKLQREMRRIAGDKLYITEDDLGKMDFLKAVIKESLRLHPPIPLLLQRQSSADVNIEGYDIAAGTQVIINCWAIGRDPASWENADEFIPERFINTSIDFKGHYFELIPFGAGRRWCPGILFAITVNELVLANLLHRFKWRLPTDGARGLQELDVIESTGITIHRKFPLILIPTLASS